ncbi:MAG: methyltransferase domain-containing protein [Gemmatimonadales bacterium]|nr:MAG: methyltransferase domain-containing protein [Gemmatimonadales bacterium]
MPVPDLSARRREPELMDDPGLEPRAHTHALRALARVNRASGTVGRIWSTLLRAAEARPVASGPLRVLDVACGDGEVAVRLAARAQRAGVPLEVHACDRSPHALNQAREKSAAAGVGLQLHRLDVLQDRLPVGFHLVTATLFLHHLSDDDAVELLRRLPESGDRLLVQDLRRTRLGYRFAWWGLRVLSSSSVARVDGPLSVRAGFTMEEAIGLARRAGLDGAQVAPIWPQRFRLDWGRE